MLQLQCLTESVKLRNAKDKRMQNARKLLDEEVDVQTGVALTVGNLRSYHVTDDQLTNCRYRVRAYRRTKTASTSLPTQRSSETSSSSNILKRVI